MNYTSIRLFLKAFVLSALLWAQATPQDLKVIIRSSSKVSGLAEASDTEKSTVCYGAMKCRTTSGDIFDRIQDFSLGQEITIDHANKSYYINSFEEINAARQKSMASQLHKLQEAAEQNPKLAAILADTILDVSARALPSSRMIAGYECKGAVYAVGGILSITVWYTSALPIRKEAYDSLGIPPDPIFGQRLRILYAEMQRSLEGFPLSYEMTINVLGNRVETDLEAVEVHSGALPADTFEPPPGYEKKSGLPPNLFGTIEVEAK